MRWWARRTGGWRAGRPGRGRCRPAASGRPRAGRGRRIRGRLDPRAGASVRRFRGARPPSRRPVPGGRRCSGRSCASRGGWRAGRPCRWRGGPHAVRGRSATSGPDRRRAPRRWWAVRGRSGSARAWTCRRRRCRRRRGWSPRGRRGSARPGRGPASRRAGGRPCGRRAARSWVCPRRGRSHRRSRSTRRHCRRRPGPSPRLGPGCRPTLRGSRPSRVLRRRSRSPPSVLAEAPAPQAGVAATSASQVSQLL